MLSKCAAPGHSTGVPVLGLSPLLEQGDTQHGTSSGDKMSAGTVSRGLKRLEIRQKIISCPGVRGSTHS